MITVGAFEAKTTLSALLERVAEGEEVLITKHGRAVARIVPAVGVDRVRARAAIAAIRREAKGRRLRGLSVRRMREKGRA
jgi:prevent-host-death family protein